jgi:hypothetical protein
MGPCYSPRRRGSNGLNRFQIRTVEKHPNFEQFKCDLFEIQKFGIKYCFEDLKKMNNFLYRNFFRFGKDLE